VTAEDPSKPIAEQLAAILAGTHVLLVLREQENMLLSSYREYVVYGGQMIEELIGVAVARPASSRTAASITASTAWRWLTAVSSVVTRWSWLSRSSEWSHIRSSSTGVWRRSEGREAATSSRCRRTARAYSSVKHSNDWSSLESERNCANVRTVGNRNRSG
jgi:hypothetical protein